MKSMMLLSPKKGFVLINLNLRQHNDGESEAGIVRAIDVAGVDLGPLISFAPINGSHAICGNGSCHSYFYIKATSLYTGAKVIVTANYDVGVSKKIAVLLRAE